MMRKCFSCRERIWSVLGCKSFLVLYLSLIIRYCLMPNSDWVYEQAPMGGQSLTILVLLGLNFAGSLSCLWISLPGQWFCFLYIRRLNLMWLELPKSFFFGFLWTLALIVDVFYILEGKYGKLDSESHFSVVSPE